MNSADPNVQRVEVVAGALGDLCAELVLLGGCAVSLLIDAPTAPPPRVTYDVDLLVELDDLLLPWMIDLSLFASLHHPALQDHINRVGVVFYQRQ